MTPRRPVHFAPNLHRGCWSRCGLYASKGPMDRRVTSSRGKVTCFKCNWSLHVSPK